MTIVLWRFHLFLVPCAIQDDYGSRSDNADAGGMFATDAIYDTAGADAVAEVAYDVGNMSVADVT